MLNFLSINRFERKKNIDLAVSAFAMLHTLEGDVLKNNGLFDATLTVAGGYDRRLRENVEYLEELKSLAEREGVSDRVSFVTSCSTAERNVLLSQCLCLLYTPKWGPMETIKNGVTGYLCDPTPQEFSLAMAKFIQDPEMAKRMGREARRHVTESFSMKTFGQHLNQFLIDVTMNKED